MSEIKKSFQQYIAKRKHTRFKPDALTLAWIDLRLDAEEFEPQIKALVFSEASGGCGLVGLTSDFYTVGPYFRIKVGELAPIDAEIVWVHELDSDVCKIGVRFAP